MPRRDLSTRDYSSHAASELEYVISSEKEKEKPKEKKVSVEDAMSQARVFESSSNRDVTRVLFISNNTELLNPTQQTLDGYINISELFDEVHILILRKGIAPQRPVLRVADNVWMYTASARFWWLMPWVGNNMIEDQLVFANGFRPDLIVARDPFESALIALNASKKYGRPAQLHILEDHTTADFLKKNKSNFWRRFIPPFIIGRFSSVRTETDYIKRSIQKKYDIPDLETLPRLHNYESLITLESSIDLKEKYKPFVFFMLFIGELSHDSTLHLALDAARFALRNPRVGLIVLGDGPAKSEFQKRAKVLEIEEQVVFESQVRNVIPYLKSAHLLIVSDANQASEEVVVQGAAAGIPMVLAKTEKREDVFEDGVSAYLCDPANVQAFTDHISDLLNHIETREAFIKAAQAMIPKKFHQDPAKYREAYRSSIEQALFVETTPTLESE